MYVKILFGKHLTLTITFYLLQKTYCLFISCDPHQLYFSSFQLSNFDRKCQKLNVKLKIQGKIFLHTLYLHSGSSLYQSCVCYLPLTEGHIFLLGLK